MWILEQIFTSVSLRETFVSKEQFVIYLAKEVLCLSEQLSVFDKRCHNIKRLWLTSETVYLQDKTGKKKKSLLFVND